MVKINEHKDEIKAIEKELGKTTLSPKRRYDLTVRRRKLLKQLAEYNSIKNSKKYY